MNGYHEGVRKGLPDPSSGGLEQTFAIISALSVKEGSGSPQRHHVADPPAEAQVGPFIYKFEYLILVREMRLPYERGFAFKGLLPVIYVSYMVIKSGD